MTQGMPRTTKPPLFGADLIARGLITPDALGRSITRQTNELCYEALRWRTGFFQFRRTAELPPIARQAALQINVDRMLLEGYRRVDEWRATMQVNVLGPVALTLSLLPALRSAGGHVVFVNSGSGINASPGLASYSGSKFALRGFADSLRNDEPSLRVTSVHPGRIATEMQEGLIAYEGRDYDPEQFLSPETVAKVIADAVNAPPDAHIHEVIVRPR